MTTRQTKAVGLALVAGAVLLWVWWWRWGSPHEGNDVTQAASDAAAILSRGRPGLDPTARGATGPVLDRKRADEMREEIRRLLAEAGTLVGSAPEPAASARTGPLSATGRPLAPMPVPGPSGDGGPDPLAAYIRDRVREDFIPLGAKCYENELEKNPTLAGRAVVKFRIVGDKRVGGVVDSAELDSKKSDLLSPSFVQCMSESMMSVTFGAPPDGHPETTVEYPFLFSPDEPDSGHY